MIELGDIRHGKGRPKGYVPYHPQRATKVMVDRILDAYKRLRDADALPAGPRQIGYRLKSSFPGVYDKPDFPTINNVITRLCQGGDLSFRWVADASAVTHDAGGWESPEDFLNTVPEQYRVDRRIGQRRVIEVCTEARETLPLIRRLGAERGVTVYSGSGSSGPNLARKVAERTLIRAVDHQQDTMLLGICDFDLAGIRNILRPHIENIAAFLYGTAGNDMVTSYEGKQMLTLPVRRGSVPVVTFTHLALTPEMARRLVDEDDAALIEAYIESGDDLWSRDLTLIEAVAKIEVEALDPIDLRQLVVDELDAWLDAKALKRVEAKEKRQRKILTTALHDVVESAPWKPRRRSS